jgi:hypothetical protein
MKRQYAAAQRLAVLTGRHPHAFPNIGDADQAWEWYAANNPYATADLPYVLGTPVSSDWMADPAQLLTGPSSGPMMTSGMSTAELRTTS